MRCATIFESPEYEVQECDNDSLILKPRSRTVHELVVHLQSKDNRKFILILLLLCKSGILIKIPSQQDNSCDNVLRINDDQVELWIRNRLIFRIPLLLKASYVLGLVDLIKHVLSRFSR